MPQKKYSKKTAKKIHTARRKNYFFRRKVLLAILFITLIGTGFYLKKTVSYYYAMYFNKFTHKKLHNTESETVRIQKIISNNLDKTYGFDISHYQNKEDISWDSLSIGNRTIPLEFVVMRATMGNRNADKHFDDFWEMAKKQKLIRGAYHFYRADEDPVKQANNFLENVKLESGDLPPILDIEKIPKRKTNEKLIEDLKVWCRIVEETYGRKPIIYTYYHYYKVFLKGELLEATSLTHDLRENYGIFCSIVVYPVIPKGMIELRLIPTAVHTLEDVQRTLDAFSEVSEKLKRGYYQQNKFSSAE